MSLILQNSLTSGRKRRGGQATGAEVPDSQKGPLKPVFAANECGAARKSYAKFTNCYPVPVFANPPQRHGTVYTLRFTQLILP
jgi:hypothetical protein